MKRHLLHPNVNEIAGLYRFRPLRRANNLLDHLDTAYRMVDELNMEREAAVRLLQRHGPIMQTCIQLAAATGKAQDKAAADLLGLVNDYARELESLRVRA
jgi:hypothetical protein